MVIKIAALIGYFFISGTIFMLDVYGNQQIAFGCLYVFFVLYSWISPFPKASIFLGLTSSTLIFVAILINYDSGLNNLTGLNMLISHAVVWITVSVVYLAKQTIINSELSRSILDTEVKERTFELKQREKRIQSMINVIQGYAIILIDKNGFVMTWNEGLWKISEFIKDDVIGKPLSIFYSEEARKQNRPYHLLLEAEKNGFAVYEGFQNKKSGKPFFAEVTISAIVDLQNNITGYTHVTRDLTEKRKLEVSRKKQRELEIQNEELEKFAFYTSHDLQEPLLTVESFVDVILKDYKNVLDDTGKEYLNILSNSVMKMRNIIKELLIYAHLGNQTDKQNVKLQEVVNSVLEVIKSTIQNSHAQIQANNLPTVYGNKVLLQQVIQNLIANAIKFHEKKATPIIKIYAEEEANRHKITVEDNGIGIDSKFHEKIFQPFNRLHAEHKFSGTGIGLAQCKRIVQLHGGEIGLKSVPGKGTSFTFFLPKF